MATAKAQFEVDDDGAVQTISVAGEKFEKLSQSADAASEAISNFEQVQKALQTTAGDLRDALGQVNSDIDDIDKRLGGIQAVANRTEASFAQLAAELPLRAEKDEFIDALNEINSDLKGGSLSVDQLSNALVGLDEQFEDTSQKADDLQSAESRLEQGTELTREEVVDLTKRLGLFDDTVKSIGPRLNELDQISRDTGKSFGKLASKIDFTDVGNIFNQIDRLKNSLNELDQEQEQAEESTDEHTRAQQRQEAQARQSANAQERFTNAVRQQSSAQSHTNEILFSTGDAIQDLQFGIRGAGNNIAFMAENFLQAGQRAGSFTSVLKGVFSALVGPVGIIVAIQTLLALGPQIADWFSSRNEEAKDLEESLKNAADSMLSFDESIQGFQVDTLEDAQNVVGELEKQDKLLDEQVGALENTITQIKSALGPQKEYTEELEQIRDLTYEEFKNKKETVRFEKERFQEISDGLNMLESQANLENITLKNVKQRLKQKRRESDANARAIEKAQQMVTNRRAQLQLEEVLKELGLERKKDTEEEADAVEEVETGLVRVENKLLDFQARQFGTGLVTDALLGSVEGPDDVQKLIDENYIQTFDQIEAAISRLRTLLQGTDVDNEGRIEKIQELIRVLKQLQRQAENTGEEVDSIGDAFKSINYQQKVVKALESNFIELGKAIGQGERVMEAFGKAALGTLADIGRMIGEQLIAQGTAMIASSIFGNAAAAVQGATLVGIGTSLVAASSFTESAISDSGPEPNDGGSQSSDDRRGGGSGEFTPGRRRGGPVSAGGLYETHGLGSREYFVPRTDGTIMTQGQMRSSTSSPGRRVKVVTENRLEGNINGPDLFELDTQLKEIDEFKSRYSES